jgi:hypothetical protein
MVIWTTIMQVIYAFIYIQLCLLRVRSDLYYLSNLYTQELILDNEILLNYIIWNSELEFFAPQNSETL